MMLILHSVYLTASEFEISKNETSQNNTFHSIILERKEIKMLLIGSCVEIHPHEYDLSIYDNFTIPPMYTQGECKFNLLNQLSIILFLTQKGEGQDEIVTAGKKTPSPAYPDLM